MQVVASNTDMTDRNEGGKINVTVFALRRLCSENVVISNRCSSLTFSYPPTCRNIPGTVQTLYSVQKLFRGLPGFTWREIMSIYLANMIAQKKRKKTAKERKNNPKTFTSLGCKRKSRTLEGFPLNDLRKYPWERAIHSAQTITATFLQIHSASTQIRRY